MLYEVITRGDRAGLALDYRGMTSDTQVQDYAESVRRTDLTLRGRIEIVDRYGARARAALADAGASAGTADAS